MENYINKNCMNAIFSTRKEEQDGGTDADGCHDGGRYIVAHQVGRAGHDERQGNDDQYAGAHVVRHSSAEETGVGRRWKPRRHHVRSDQRAVARWTRTARPVAGPQSRLRSAGGTDCGHHSRGRTTLTTSAHPSPPAPSNIIHYIY